MIHIKAVFITKHLRFFTKRVSSRGRKKEAYVSNTNKSNHSATKDVKFDPLSFLLFSKLKYPLCETPQSVGALIKNR